MTPTILHVPARDTSSRNGQPILAIVLHATAGTNSLKWLKGNPEGTSIHVLITKTGLIYRMVPDDRAAHHCGYSRWMHNGIIYSRNNRRNVNQVTLGIELENLNNGKDPYPAAQLTACAWQIDQWLAAYGNLVLLHHRDIDTQGKTDPRGMTVDEVLKYRSPSIFAVDRTSPILFKPRTDAATCIRSIQRRGTDKSYTDLDVKIIVSAYYRVCESVGVDPVVAIAQMVHETANLRTWWSTRPRRNPSNIGVTGATNTGPKPEGQWSQAPDGQWVEGALFPTWEQHAIPAHVARFVALCIPEERQSPHQRALVQAQAPSVMSLPPEYLGKVETIEQLARVSSTQPTYVAHILSVMNALMGAP